MKKIIIIGLILLSSCTFSKENTKTTFKNHEIYKTKYNTFGLTSKDIDNDGKDDLIMINNYDSSISIFYQLSENEIEQNKKNFYQNITEDEINKVSFDFRFKNIPMITERNVKAFAIDNLLGDKKKEIVYLSSNGELFLAQQDKKRNFKKKLLYDITDILPSQYSLAIKDINDDKLSDIVLLGKNFIYIFYQNKKFKEPLKLSYNSKSALGVELKDVNGDKLNDILFVTGDNGNKIKVRLQEKNHSIGPEQSIDFPNFSFLYLKNFIKNKKGIELISSRAKGNMIFIDKLVKNKKNEFPKPLNYSLDPEAENPNKNIIWGDFNSDSHLDFIVSDPAISFFMFFEGKNGNFKNYTKIPSFKGIIKSRKIKINKKDKLIVFSKEEEVLALYDINKKIPEVIESNGEILNFDIYNNKLFTIIKRDDKIFFEENKIKNNKLSKIKSYKIDAKDDLIDILVLDYNYDKKADLIISYPYENSDFFISKNKKIKKLEVKLKAISSFFKQISNNQISFIDLDGDKKKEFVISNKNIIRGIKFEKNNLKIIYQINAENNSDLSNIIKSGKNKIFAFDRTKNKISIFNKKYKLSSSIKISGILVSELISKDLDKDGNEEIILVGRTNLMIFNKKKSAYSIKNLHNYKLSNPNSISSIISSGNFGGKKIVSVDGRRNFIEFFKIKDNKIVFDSRFKVFEQKSYRRKKSFDYEPKELIVHDINNDKLDDIIIRVHNKIIIYYQ